MTKCINIFFMFVVLSTFSQERLDKVCDTTITRSKADHDIEAFIPDTKLLNTSIWNRVTANRFECKFLRLAVELRNNEYWLLEMDGLKCLLARDKNYTVISHVITQLTLRSTPKLMEYNNLQEKEFDNYYYIKVLFLLYFGY